MKLSISNKLRFNALAFTPPPANEQQSSRQSFFTNAFPFIILSFFVSGPVGIDLALLLVCIHSKNGINCRRTTIENFLHQNECWIVISKCFHLSRRHSIVSSMVVASQFRQTAFSICTQRRQPNNNKCHNLFILVFIWLVEPIPFAWFPVRSIAFSVRLFRCEIRR